MAAITAKMVKELREKSGAGMMDCKKALTATDGDMEKAIDFLRENGKMKAAKKADRIAAEGLCYAEVSEDEMTGVAVEINSETDFVAKNEKFQNFVATVADQIMKSDVADVDALKASTLADGKTVDELLTEEIATIGENIKIRRFVKVVEENGFVASYTHMGGKIVVLVDVETDVINDAVKDMAKNVAMQAAAMRPQYCSRNEIGDDFLAKEKEILLAAAKNEKPNAPDKVINGIVMGRLNKELSEICLLDQVYVKAEDGKQSVAKYVAQVAKENGAKISVKSFVRFETGEGLEKKSEDFAAEVAAQRKGDFRDGLICCIDHKIGNFFISRSPLFHQSSNIIFIHIAVQQRPFGAALYPVQYGFRRRCEENDDSAFLHIFNIFISHYGTATD